MVQQRITSDTLQPVRQGLSTLLRKTCPVAVDVRECVIAHVEDCGGFCGGHSAGRCCLYLPHDANELFYRAIKRIEI